MMVVGTVLGRQGRACAIITDALEVPSTTLWQRRWGTTRTRPSWPTATGRFRAVSQGPDGNLHVALEDQGVILRVKPQ